MAPAHAAAVRLRAIEYNFSTGFPALKLIASASTNKRQLINQTITSLRLTVWLQSTKCWSFDGNRTRNPQGMA
jgi:hypothetical protein